MSNLRGSLIVTVTFRIPVSGKMYPLIIKEKGEVCVEDIVAAEEENYTQNEDSYFELFGDHISEVDISFEEGRSDA